MAKIEDYLIETADRLKRLAKLGKEVGADLEVIRNELMNKAVELETDRQRSDKPAGGKA
jgi:Fe2+ transport system protein FeoA